MFWLILDDLYSYGIHAKVNILVGGNFKDIYYYFSFQNTIAV